MRISSLLAGLRRPGLKGWLLIAAVLGLVVGALAWGGNTIANRTDPITITPNVGFSLSLTTAAPFNAANDVPTLKATLGNVAGIDASHVLIVSVTDTSTNPPQLVYSESVRRLQGRVLGDASAAAPRSLAVFKFAIRTILRFEDTKSSTTFQDIVKQNVTAMAEVVVSGLKTADPATFGSATVEVEPPAFKPLPSRSVTPTVTPSTSTSPSVTPSTSVSPSVTPSTSVSPSVTPSTSVSPSVTPSASVTASASTTVTPTTSSSASVSTTVTVTPSASTSASVTRSASVTPTTSRTPSFSITPSASVSRTPSATTSVTPSTSVTASASTTITRTPSVSPSMSITVTITPSASTSASVTRSASVTPTTSRTPSFSITPSASVSRTPSRTTSITPSTSVTPSISPSASISASVTPSASVSPSVTPSASMSPSITPSATVSASITPSRTGSPSLTPTRSASATPTPWPVPMYPNSALLMQYLGQPYAMGRDAQGSVFVLEFQGRKVSRFDRGATSMVTLVSFTGGYMASFFLEPSGTFVVGSTGLTRYDRDGTLVKVVAAANSYGSSYGMTGDGTYLYVADYTNKKMLRMLADDGSGLVDMNFPGPQAKVATVGVTGTLYVMDSSDDKIYKCTNPQDANPVWVEHIKVVASSTTACGSQGIIRSSTTTDELLVGCTTTAKFVRVSAASPPQLTVLSFYENGGIQGLTPFYSEDAFLYGTANGQLRVGRMH